MNIVNKTDHYIAKLAQSKRVKVITFFLAFFEQSFSPILVEAYILIILSYRKDISWKLISFISALGSTLGAFVTYCIGFILFQKFGEHVIDMFEISSFVDRARVLYSDNVFIAQFMTAFTPLPDRIFSFIAGMFGASLLLVLSATFCGRFLRAAIVAYLAYEWGDEAREFIKKHTRLAMVVAIFLVALYVLYKVLG
jgi:membrane protein YqaA with SNARE-associated domain